MAKHRTAEDLEDEDGDYQPSEHDDDPDEDLEFTVEEIKDELISGDWELTDERGDVTIIKGSSTIAEEKDDIPDEEILAAVRADKRFEGNTLRGKARLYGVIKRYKEDLIRYHSIVVCSDDWTDYGRIPVKNQQIIACKAGLWILDSTDSNTEASTSSEVPATKVGRKKLRKMTAEELANSTEDMTCECKICTKRRVNSAITAPRSSLRSGKNREAGTWKNYGAGRKL